MNFMKNLRITWRLWLIVSVSSILASCDNSKCFDIVPLGEAQVTSSGKVTLSFRVFQCGSNVPAPSLPLDSFRISENGEAVSLTESRQRFAPKPQSYRSVTSILLDLSGSVRGSIQSLQDAAIAAVRTFLPANDPTALQTRQVTVSAFSGSQKVFLIGSAGGSNAASVQTLETQIRAIRCSEPILTSDPAYCQDPSTNLYGAIATGAQDLDALVSTLGSAGQVSIVEGSLVTFTDGRDRANWATSEEAYRVLLNSKTKIASYTIGLGSEIDTPTLKRLGTSGFFPVQDASQLSNSFQGVMAEILAQANSVYSVEYCTPIRRGDVQIQLIAENEGRRGDEYFHFKAPSSGGTCELFR